MKKSLFLVTLGFIIHMLYLDFIIYQKYSIISGCDINEKPLKNGVLPCLKYGNETPTRYKFKYFGIAELLSFKNLITGPWRFE